MSAISTIAFVGLGNMGLPMVRNLLKAGFTVRTFDLSAEAMAATERDGAKPAPAMRDAVADVDCVFTMLPMGKDVEAVFRGDEGLLAVTRPGALLVDSSTISSAISRALSVEVKARGRGVKRRKRGRRWRRRRVDARGRRLRKAFERGAPPEGVAIGRP